MQAASTWHGFLVVLLSAQGFPYLICNADAALSFGVHAHGRVPGATGVWVGDKKLGAVGIKVSDGISTHGLAFNVAKGLADQRRSPFSLIVPCG